MTDQERAEDMERNPGHYCTHGIHIGRKERCRDCTPNDRAYWVWLCNEAEERDGNNMVRADKAERDMASQKDRADRAEILLDKHWMIAKRMEEERNSFKTSADHFMAESERLRTALERLASTESFTVAFDAKFANASTLWAELRARGEFATAALQGKKLDL